jgi:hypothetical protein
MYCTWQVKRFAYDVDLRDWEADGTVIDEAYDIRVTRELGAGRDGFEFKVSNASGTYTNYFQPNDKIEIRRAVNSNTFVDSDLLMIGSINNTPSDLMFNNSVLRVEGNNFSKTIMEALVFIDPAGLTIPETIKAALEHVQAYNQNFKVVWHPDNPALRTDGTAFPTVNDRFYNKPLLEILEKYSTEDATEDEVSYYWYVDNNNQLVWRPEETSVSQTFNINTNDYVGLSLDKDTSDVVNYVIAKAGVDPRGKAIQDRYYDLASMAKHGPKYHIITQTNNHAGSLFKDDMTKLGIGDDASGLPSDAGAIYPFTTSWGESVSDDDDYVEKLRAEAKRLARLEAQNLVKFRQNGKQEINVDFMPGKAGWELGENIQCTIPHLSDSAVTLRVIGVVIDEMNEAYELEEDKGTV